MKFVWCRYSFFSWLIFKKKKKKNLRFCLIMYKNSLKLKNIKIGMWDKYINIFVLYNLIFFIYKNWLNIFCEYIMVYIFWKSKFKIYFFLIINIRYFIFFDRNIYIFVNNIEFWMIL